jgi:hypothetical protein
MKPSDMNRVLVDVNTGNLFRSASLAAKEYGVSAAYIIMIANGTVSTNHIKMKWIALNACRPLPFL